MKQANINSIKPGDEVILDNGFTCMRAGKALVKSDGDRLFISCDDGRHYLDGQIDGDDGQMVGIYVVA